MLSPQLVLKMLPSSTLGRVITRPLATTLGTGLSIKLLIFQSSIIVTHIQMTRPTLGNAQLTCCSNGECLSEQREAAAENTKHLTPLAYSGDYMTQHLPVHHRLETHYDSITEE